MNKLKQLIGKKKNVILAIIAILLIVFTAYQLKFVGIAADDDSEIIETSEVAESETQSLDQDAEIVESNETNTIENLVDNAVSEDNFTNTAGLEVQENVENASENITNTVENELDAENTVSDTVEGSTTITEEVAEIPSELIFDNGEYKVTVSAVKEDALKNIKEVKVSPITADINSEEYNEISEKLQNKLDDENLTKSIEEKEEIAGFLAYDITLISEDGTELEPDGDVNVSIEYMVVPEEAVKYADADVSVIHFEENNQNDEVLLEEYSQNSNNLNVETNTENQVKKLEFETDSFSTFVITWETTWWGNTTTYAEITVHYVDSQGNGIQGTQTRNVNAYRNNTITLSDYAGNIPGYSYQSAHYNVIGGSIITRMTFTLGYDAVNNRNNINNVTFYNGETEVANLDYTNDTKNIDIYLVYTRVGNLVLTDSIANDGNLNAVLTDESGNDISNDFKFTWYKADSQNGTAEEVERIKITGSSYNISEDGKSLNVALDNGSDKWYYVVATDSNENTFISERYHVDYYDDIRNGSFETPNIKGLSGSSQAWGNERNGVTRYYNIERLSDFIWKTTASSQNIEIARNGTQNNTWFNSNSYSPGGAYEGKQFIELNGDTAGALYQDVLTIPGQQLNWQLAHRGRTGTDTMYVVIMSTKDAEKYDVTTQEKVEYIVNNIEDFPGVYVRKITDGNTLWGTHNGYYNVPAEQYLTRLFFVAGDTASNDNTMGNFIDDVRIGQDIEPTEPGKAIVTVRKEIKGLSNEDDLTNYSLTISEDENSISKIYTGFIWDNTENVWYLEQTYEISTGDYQTVNAIFTETNPETIIEGYSFVSAEYQFEDENTVTLTSEDGYSTNELTLEEEKYYTLVFTNTYELDNATITLNKQNVFGDLLGGATFKITENGTSNTQTIDDTDGDGKFVFDNIKYDTTYVIEEVSTPNDDKYYKLETPIQVSVSKETGRISILNSSDNEMSKYVSLSDDGKELNVINIKHTEMPEAGGMGVYWFYILGSVIMIGTVIIYKKKKI